MCEVAVSPKKKKTQKPNKQNPKKPNYVSFQSLRDKQERSLNRSESFPKASAQNLLMK